MDKQQAESMYANSARYLSDGALKIRLDTSELLEMIEYNLKGYKEQIIEETDDKGKKKIIIKRIATGKPKANDEGIQEIIRWLNSILHPAVVQGNYTEDMYHRDLYRIRVGFATNLMTNLNKYEIDQNNYGGIIDSIMNTVRPFLSRLLANKERESYADTIKSNEAIMSGNSGGFHIPFIGGGK